MSKTFDYILIAAALIVGIMLLTGHGEIFMKGGNSSQRDKIYDEKKTEKVFGVALVLIGILTGIDTLMDSMAMKLIYLAGVLIIFAGAIWYMRTKCKK